MRFGFLFPPHVTRWQIVQEAERLGYHRVWVGDSQMLYSDCYVTLALAAANSHRIHVGTGITTPGTRLAPVTACAIATINRLAPGRTFMGIGTGHTAMRLMGQLPASIAELRDCIRVVRGLLDGDAVEFSHKGRTHEIRFMHDDPTYLNLEDRIPLYVAANGPKALGVVGRLGDGWITAGGLIPSIVSQQFAQITLAARVVGRTLPSDFLACNNVTACVLRRGEKLTSDRVIQLAGPIVTTNLHFAFEVWEQSGRNNELIPPFLRNIWDEFVVHVNEHGSPQAPRFQKLHAKHGTSLQAEERRFVTRETIQGSCLVGEPDEMVAQIGELQRAGLTELSLMPPAGSEYEVLRDFSRLIMPHFKDAP